MVRKIAVSAIRAHSAHFARLEHRVKETLTHAIYLAPMPVAKSKQHHDKHALSPIWPH